MNINFQLGTKDDIDELEQLYDDLNDYLASGTNYPGWKKGVYPARQNAVNGVDSNNLYVAKHNGKIIGSIILNHKFDPAYNTVNWGLDLDHSEFFVIHTFLVHPEFLKSGVGNALIDFAINHGIKSQVKAIRLDVYQGNLPAITLYEKFGFKYIATVDLGLKDYGLDWFKLYEKLL